MLLHKMTEDLSFRLFTLDDAEEVFTLINNSRTYLREYLGWVDNTTEVNDSENWIKTTLQGMVETGGFPTTFAIIYGGEIAGTIGLQGINRANRSASIGYWLGEGFQGKGIMTKACSNLMDYGFNEFKLNRISIEAAFSNEKSRAIPERLGFQEEGHIRQAEWLYDHYVDHVVYGMLAEEWKNYKK